MSDLDRLPSRISPSRASDYMNCPKAFFYKTIEKRPTKNTVQNTRGTLAHTALEEMFKLPRNERTPERVEKFVAPAWEELKQKTSYQGMVEEGSQEEADMLEFARRMVHNYFTIENPQRFDATELEYHVSSTSTGVEIHGYIDRFDVVNSESENPQPYITDYKTGKVPQPRYLDKAFFAMRIYAMCVYEMTGVMPVALRLVYLQKNGNQAIKTVLVNEAMISRARADVSNVWTKIKASAATGNWETKTGPLCNWCDFKPICPAFAKN